MKKWLVGLMSVGMLATAAWGSLASPATLPVEYAGASGWSNATLDAMTGWDATGLGSPYTGAGGAAKMDSAGDNVIIYFDAAAQLRLWDKFCRQLRPGGWLLIGHSERIPDHLRTRLRPVGHTVYQYDPGRGET